MRCLQPARRADAGQSQLPLPCIADWQALPRAACRSSQARLRPFCRRRDLPDAYLGCYRTDRETPSRVPVLAGSAGVVCLGLAQMLSLSLSRASPPNRYQKSNVLAETENSVSLLLLDGISNMRGVHIALSILKSQIENGSCLRPHDSYRCKTIPCLICANCCLGHGAKISCDWPGIYSCSEERILKRGYVSTH